MRSERNKRETQRKHIKIKKHEIRHKDIIVET